MRMRVRASSALNGSSASSSSGSRISERASATRCCSPPESVRGHLASSPGKPHLASAVSARAGRRVPSPRTTLSITCAQGSRRESWNSTERRHADA